LALKFLLCRFLRNCRTLTEAPEWANSKFFSVILGLCILGIGSSAFLIDIHEKPGTNRRINIGDLYRIVDRAEQYYERSVEKGGGDGSFFLSLGRVQRNRGIANYSMHFQR